MRYPNGNVPCLKLRREGCEGFAQWEWLQSQAGYQVRKDGKERTQEA